MRTAQTMWIIGASAGIGRALCQQYANAGARLIVSARDGQALDALLEEVADSRQGKSHLAIRCDVTNDASIVEAVQTIQQHTGGHIDRVVFMAGVYQPMKLDQLDLAKAQHIIDVNLMGAFRLVHHALPLLKTSTSPKPQMALCASISGYRGLPRSQPYAATKAALINLAESLRAECGDWLDVRVINPGFVKTRLTDKNDFTMPMIISAERAAVHIVKGLERSAFEVHFPKRSSVFMKLLAMLPDRLYFRLMRLMRRW